MNRLLSVELIWYKHLNYTVLRFYREHRVKAYRDPSERAMAWVAMAVEQHDKFRVRPFLAGNVGWVADWIGE